MAANVVAQLNIVFTDDGKINVTGSIENKMLAYGLLESAKEAICEHHRRSAQLVQPAAGFVVPPGLKGS